MIYDIWPNVDDILYNHQEFSNGRKLKEIFNNAKCVVCVLSVIEPKRVNEFIEDTAQFFYEDYLDNRGQNKAGKVYDEVIDKLTEVAEKYQ